MDALYSARVILWCSMLSHCSKHRASGVVYHWRFDIGSGIRNDARVSIGAQRRGRFGAKEVSCIPFIPSRKMLVTPECRVRWSLQKCRYSDIRQIATKYEFSKSTREIQNIPYRSSALQAPAGRPRAKGQAGSTYTHLQTGTTRCSGCLNSHRAL